MKTATRWFPRATRKGLWLSAIAALSVVPSVALANTPILVRLLDAEGRPLDGRVTLTRSGSTIGCATTAGRCTIDAPSGDYVASVAPIRGVAPPSRSLQVRGDVPISVTFQALPAPPSEPAASPSPSPSEGASASGPSPSSPAPQVTATGSRGATSEGRAATLGPNLAPGASSGTASSGAFRPIGTAALASVSDVRLAAAGPNAQRDDGSGRIAPARASAAAAPPTNTTTPPAVAQAATVATPVSPERSLSAGAQLVAQGRVLDRAGRPVDAAITVARDGARVGSVHSTAGRFSMFDLEVGAYDVRVAPVRGAPISARLNVAPGVVARPTYTID